jgi:cytochrome c556
MTWQWSSVRRSGGWTRATVLAGRLLLTAAILLGPVYAAISQEAGVTPPKDMIFARKVLMGAIDTNMEEIEAMAAEGGTLDLNEAREHADMISIMLLTFPHLFPQTTNQWTANADRDPATDTFASPQLWSNFADFYQRAAAASKLALDASKAGRAAEFKALVLQLRAACDSCHAAYQKVN